MDAVSMPQGKTLEHHKMAQSLATEIVENQILPLAEQRATVLGKSNIHLDLETLSLPGHWIDTFLVLALKEKGYPADVTKTDRRRILKISLDASPLDEKDELISDGEYIALLLLIGVCLYLFLTIIT